MDEAFHLQSMVFDYLQDNVLKQAIESWIFLKMLL